MKNFSVLIVYSLNILVFIVILVNFLGTSYELLTTGSTATRSGVAVWPTRIIIASIIDITLPFVAFFILNRLTKFKKQERFIEFFILGVLGAAGLIWILFISILQTLVVSMM